MKINSLLVRHLTKLFLYLATLTFASASVEASVLEGYLGGTAYLTYNQDVWATMKTQMYRADTHGNPVNNGALVPTSNTYGNRFLYPQLFVDYRNPLPISAPGLASDELIANGTADPQAVAKWRIFDPAQRIPLAQPRGGWAMLIDTLQPGLSRVGQDYIRYLPSSFDSDHSSDPLHSDDRYREYISLGGSLRLASDFVAPSGSLWFGGMSVFHDFGSLSGPKWYIGTSAQGIASIFELIDPVFGINAEGLMTLEADYKWGDSQWSSFFRFQDDPEGVSEKILGHISMNHSAVPVPAAAWLFGSALFELVGFRHRKSLS